MLLASQALRVGERQLELGSPRSSTVSTPQMQPARAQSSGGDDDAVWNFALHFERIHLNIPGRLCRGRIRRYCLADSRGPPRVFPMGLAAAGWMIAGAERQRA